MYVLKRVEIKINLAIVWEAQSTNCLVSITIQRLKLKVKFKIK